MSFFHEEPKVTNPEAKPVRLVVSKDGYIRLTFGELQGTRLTHLISGLDENEKAHPSSGAIQSVISGYTEWLSDGSPGITLGWDWNMEFVNGRIQLLRVGQPRSNLLLQDDKRHDIAYEQSLVLQEAYVDGMNWQSIAQEQINLRYR